MNINFTEQTVLFFVNFDFRIILISISLYQSRSVKTCKKVIFPTLYVLIFWKMLLFDKCFMLPFAIHWMLSIDLNDINEKQI